MRWFLLTILLAPSGVYGTPVVFTSCTPRCGFFYDPVLDEESEIDAQAYVESLAKGQVERGATAIVTVEVGGALRDVAHAEARASETLTLTSRGPKRLGLIQFDTFWTSVLNGEPIEGDAFADYTDGSILSVISPATPAFFRNAAWELCLLIWDRTFSSRRSRPHS